MSRTPALALSALLAVGGLAACSESEQAEVEQQVEDGAERVGEGAEDAGDEIQEQVEEGAEESGEG